MTGTGTPLTDVKSLTDLPLLGPMVVYVERAAVDLGIPSRLRELAVLVLLGMVAYLALRLIARRIFR